MPASTRRTAVDHSVAAECLRTLGHPLRLQMLFLLESGEHNVGDLAAACGVASQLASEHLRLMEHCGLLIREKAGKETFYRIAEPCLSEILHCLEARFGTTAKRGAKS